MKIALIGYGKMGRKVEEVALEKGHHIAVKIDPKGDHSIITPEILHGVDVCIDFTHPDHAISNLKRVSACGKNMVMGTTGWYDHLAEAKKIVSQSNIGFLYSPNFSLGIALFLSLIAKAGTIMTPFKEYDVSGLEIHHNKKLDQPSGTAIAISNHLHKHMPGRNQINFSSQRVGSVPGTHTIMFDSPVDTITLTHTARNRDGFATGAVQSAEWLAGKKGFFTLDDMLQDLYE